MSNKQRETKFTVKVWDVDFDVYIIYTKPFQTSFDYNQPPEQAEFQISGVYLIADSYYDLSECLSHDCYNLIEEEVKEQFIEFINEQA